MMIGEKVLDHDGDHWLGLGRVRGMNGAIAFVRLVVFSFSLVAEMFRVAWFMFWAIDKFGNMDMSGASSQSLLAISCVGLCPTS